MDVFISYHGRYNSFSAPADFYVILNPGLRIVHHASLPMPILRDWKLSLSIDQILRAQGITPHDVERSSRLRETAAQALKIGLPVLDPAVAYRQFKVKAVQHERLVLLDGEDNTAMQYSLAGKEIVRLLAPSRQIIVMVCTIGEPLEKLAAVVLPDNMPLGLALDAIGSAAVQALVEAACAFFGEYAASRGWQTTPPLSPGMQSWPVDHGQKQLFALVNGAKPLSELLGVTLMTSGMMAPQKSATGVIGMGPEVDGSGRVCDYCSVRQTCRYQDQYSKYVRSDSG